MRTRQTLLAALLLAASAGLVSTPSYAQRGDCYGSPMGGPVDGRGPAQRAERMKVHQQRLHDALKLNPDQEAAWASFQASHPGALRDERPDRAELDKLTAPERAERMLAWQQKHQAAMTQHLSAMKTFYEQLTPEQKKVFDQHPRQRPNAGPRGQRGAGGGPSGPQTPPAR